MLGGLGAGATWKNSPAVAVVDAVVEELLGVFWIAAEEDMGTAEWEVEVVTLMGVIIVVGSAKLTLAPPAGEVTGTGAGTDGAVEEFIAESSQALIHPW